MASLSLAALLLAIVALVVAKCLKTLFGKEEPLVGVNKLPGPKGLPIIGNVHELPAKCSWMKFHEWSLEYGPIYQVNLAGTNHVWIARDKIAHDLLSKRSNIYSDRPFIPALEHDNRTSGQYLPLMSKNLVWSRQRRFAKQIMDRSQKDSFYAYPELESIRLLFELMSDPSKYNSTMESFIARVTSRLAWGTSAPAEELKQRARELLIGVSPTGSLGNKLPAIMSLPQRLVKAKAWELRRGRTEKKFFETMQEEVRRTLPFGRYSSMPTSPLSPFSPRSPYPSLPTPTTPSFSTKQSWTRMFLENQASWGFSSALEGAYAVGMHGIAGALTIAAPMQSFCLAMVHYPQYQHLLHEEIDRVLGDRMPTFGDMPDMPVLRAFIRETLRWRPPVPTGIPHEVTQDDIYEGYYIPKGSVIHPLEWSISRDPDVFPEPDSWNPCRWIDSKYPTYQEPLSKYPTITQYSQFGYGRRNCQGMGVTEADLFVGLGSIAWLFSIHANEETEARSETEQRARSSESPEPASSEQRQSTRQDSCVSLASSVGTIGTDSSADEEETLELSRQTTIRDNEEDTLDLSRQNTIRSTMTIHANDSAISLLQDIPEVKVEHVCQTCGTTPKDTATAPARSAKRQSCFARLNTNVLPVPKPTVRKTKPTAIKIQERPIEQAAASPLPGSWDFLEASAPEHKQKRKAPPSYESDPTMNFSTLLIAKPLPFKFDLRIRNQVRAQAVAQKWVQRKMEGEFEDSRVYWKNGNEGDSDVGWGETFT